MVVFSYHCSIFYSFRMKYLDKLECRQNIIYLCVWSGGRSLPTNYFERCSFENLCRFFVFKEARQRNVIHSILSLSCSFAHSGPRFASQVLFIFSFDFVFSAPSSSPLLGDMVIGDVRFSDIRPIFSFFLSRLLPSPIFSASCYSFC